MSVNRDNAPGESVFWALVGGLLLLTFAANAVWGA